MGKSLAFTLPLHIYPFDIRFSFAEKFKEVRKYFKENGTTGMDMEKIRYGNPDCQGYYVSWDSGEILIRMKAIPGDWRGLSIIQHEITHVVCMILTDKIGMEHNRDSTEAFAYLTDYITREVYRNLPMFENGVNPS